MRQSISGGVADGLAIYLICELQGSNKDRKGAAGLRARS